MPKEWSIIIAATAADATADELRALEEWRAASADNERSYQAFMRFWEESARVEPPVEVGPPPTVDEVVRIAGERARSGPSGDRSLLSGKVRSPRMPTARGVAWLAIAAGLVGLGIGLAEVSGDGEGSEALDMREFVTGAGALSTVTLSDGTVVRLAPDTRLVIEGGRDRRQVYLEGRAYFVVTRNPEQPFTVRTRQGEVRVLGTRFDAHGSAEGLEVVVVEGEVEVSAGGERVRAVANELAHVAGPGGPPAAVEAVADLYERLSWMGEFIAFESTPLPQVAEEFRRRFGLEIRIDDPALEGRSVTGWFTEQTPEQMLEGICRVVDARCTTRDGVLRMDVSAPAAGTLELAR